MSGNKIKKASSSATNNNKRKDLPPPLPSTPPPYLTNYVNSLNEGAVCQTECPFTSEQHEGREFAKVSLSLPAKELYRLIFEEETLIVQTYNDKNYVDIVFSPWTKNEDSGDWVRTLTYTAHLPSKALGPSISYVTEVQTRSSLNQENELYVVNCEVTNSGIPYGDSFKICNHYCIINKKSPISGTPHCRFSFYSNVKFKKTPFFVIKGLIEKSSYDGLQNICEALVQSLMEKAENVNGIVKKSRRKRPASELEEPSIRKEKHIKNGSEGNSNRFRNCSAILVFFLLISIAILNVYLYLQLKQIEQVTIFKTNLLLEHSSNTELKKDTAELTLEETIKNFMIKSSILEENFLEWKTKLYTVFISLNESIIELGELMELLPSYMMKFKSLSLELEDVLWRREEPHEVLEELEDINSPIEIMNDN